MRQSAASWPDSQITPQPVAQLPWGHVRCLLDKLGDPARRLWYAQSAVEDGWSRNVLEHHIATGRYEREGKALTNFSRTLPAPESDAFGNLTADLRDLEQWLRLPAGRRPAPPKPREGSRQMWLLPAFPPEPRETKEMLPRAWEHLGMIEMLTEPSHASSGPRLD